MASQARDHTHLRGPILGRGGEIDEAPVEFSNAARRHKAIVNKFANPLDVTESAALGAGTLWVRDPFDAVTPGAHTVGLTVPTAGPFRGECVAEFAATAINSGAQWVHGLTHGSGFRAPFQGYRRQSPKRTHWCAEIGFVDAPAGGAIAIGVMDHTSAPLLNDGTLPIGPRMYGFRTTPSGELRIFHADQESTNIDVVVGTVAQGDVLRLGIIQSSWGVLSGTEPGTLPQVYEEGSWVKYFINGSLVLNATPGNIGGSIPPLYEEPQESPGLCVISVGAAPFRVRCPYWGHGAEVLGRNEEGFAL